MPASNSARKPELVLGAAAMLLAAGVLVVTGAQARAARTSPAGLTTAVLGTGGFVNPFQAPELPPETPGEPGGTVIGYTGVEVYEFLPEATAPPAQAKPPGQTAKATSPQWPLNINAASQAQLEALPGIGPVKAQAILEWRAANGRFTDPAQLLEIKGIGEKTLMKLLPFIMI